MTGFDALQVWLLVGAWVAAFLLGKELCAGYNQRQARIVVREAEWTRIQPEGRPARTIAGPCQLPRHTSRKKGD